MTMTTAAPPWIRHLRPSLAGLDEYDIAPVPARARLAANECAEPWPAEVMAAVAKRVQEVELGRYPDTSGRALRGLIAARHNVEPGAVVLGNGSDEIIGFLLSALGGRPSEPSFMVIPSPTFQMFGHSARVRGIGVLEVPLTEDLQLDENLMHEALDVALGAALCFLARPNNPTSSLWDAQVVARLIERHPGTVFVIDEAYIRYAPGASLWRGDLPHNVVYMSTLSKIGLAGLRIGYCIAPPPLRHPLNVVRNPYNVSATSLAVAELILTKFAGVQQQMIDRVIAARKRLVGILGKIPKAHVFPAHANFAVVRLDPPEEAPRVAAELAKRGILVKDASSLPRLAGCLRIGVGTDHELDLLDKALKEIVPAGG
jgi:histidinol-phosphate aminotransferase